MRAFQMSSILCSCLFAIIERWTFTCWVLDCVNLLCSLCLFLILILFSRYLIWLKSKRLLIATVLPIIQSAVQQDCVKTVSCDYFKVKFQNNQIVTSKLWKNMTCYIQHENTKRQWNSPIGQNTDFEGNLNKKTIFCELAICFQVVPFKRIPTSVDKRKRQTLPVFYHLC